MKHIMNNVIEICRGWQKMLPNSSPGRETGDQGTIFELLKACRFSRIHEISAYKLIKHCKPYHGKCNEKA